MKPSEKLRRQIKKWLKQKPVDCGECGTTNVKNTLTTIAKQTGIPINTLQSFMGVARKKPTVLNMDSAEKIRSFIAPDESL